MYLKFPNFEHTLDKVLDLSKIFQAAIAQLGERQTEDLKVPGSIPGGGTFLDFK